jgi:hypothetical protein
MHSGKTAYAVSVVSAHGTRSRGCRLTASDPPYSVGPYTSAPEALAASGSTRVGAGSTTRTQAGASCSSVAAAGHGVHRVS